VPDLTTTSVFLDFDGTITLFDSGVHLLERLAPPEWRAVDAEYARGEIGSRVCLLDEWDLLPHDEARLRATVREVAVDPGAAPLVAALRAAGAEVMIVSDGFGFYATEVAATLGVPVLTNAVDWSSGRLEFPHADRCCACSSCGVCKQAPIKDARHAGRTTVLVGDGVSDGHPRRLVRGARGRPHPVHDPGRRGRRARPGGLRCGWRSGPTSGPP
jgi:HAD superfamily phosphoserine phosphatase-like hydrolase